MKKSKVEECFRSDMSLQNLFSAGLAELKCIPLLVMDGTFNEILARILKDSGCTANVISQEYARTHHKKFTFSPVLVDGNHSKQGANKIAM